MIIELWLKEADRELFENTCDIQLSEYSATLLKGNLRNPGILSKIGKKFVLGKKGIWIPKGTAQKFPFVYIKSSSAYPERLILTPYSDIDIEFHREGKTIDKKTGVHRQELFGSDQDDFVERVFKTYDDSLILKHKERDNHLLLYFPQRAR